jgi:hypothetical protein
MKVIPIVLVLLIIGVFGFAATQPDAFYVERVLRMQAPPERIFPLVSDFKNWQDWSPWVAKDPAIRVTLGARTRGMGAVYEWSGNKDVGEGRMEMLMEIPPTSVRLNLSIFEPFTANNLVGFSLEPRGDYTKVTWHMEGGLSYTSKLFNLFNSMDAMVGPDLQAGLDNIKAMVED